MITRNFEEFSKSKGLKGRNAMKRNKLLPILVLMLTSLAFAQSAPSRPAIFKRGASGNAAGTRRTGGPARTTA